MEEIEFVVQDVLITRGAGKTQEEARLRSRARLSQAVRQIEVGQLPEGEGIQFLTDGCGPGGGGGPCAPNKKIVEYTTTAGGLSEANERPNGDDD